MNKVIGSAKLELRKKTVPLLKRLRNASVFSCLFLSVVVLLLFVPFYIMVVTSLKTEGQILGNFWAVSRPPAWGNYIRAWGAIHGYFLNSVKVTGLSVLGIIIVSVFGGYAFGRYEFRFKNTLFMCLMAFQMIPASLLLIPSFLNITSLGLYDSHWGVIFPNIAGSSIMGILLTRGFVAGLPASIFESAYIDGAKEFTVLTKITLPLCVPIIGTLTVFNLFGIFNQFMWPYIVISRNSMMTVPIGLAKLSGQYGVNFGFQMAGYTIVSIPLVIFFASTMKIYVSGVTAGAIKA